MSTLCRVPEVRDYVLPINFADTPEAAATSARSRRDARALLKAWWLPDHFSRWRSIDLRASRSAARSTLTGIPFAGRLIMAARASVLPVQFEGQNSRLFQLVSRFS